MKFAVFSLVATTVSAFAPSTFHSSRAGISSMQLNANVVDTLATLQGPGQVWGAEGIMVGKEESEFKGYDNFGLFSQRLQSSGVAATLAGPGPFTVFAPTDSAIESYEATRGPVDASVISYLIVPGQVSASAVPNTPLNTLSGGTIGYSRKFRKDFVQDAILGETTFGPYADFPIDVACDNGVIHSIGMVITPN